MTPPRNADDHCGGCFLYERRGVCPAAREAHDLENSAQAEARAAQFRAAVSTEAERQDADFSQAVAAEAEQTFSLADLMQIETERQVLGAPLHWNWSLPARATADLPAAASPTSTSISARKEAAYVPTPRKPQ